MSFRRLWLVAACLGASAAWGDGRLQADATSSAGPAYPVVPGFERLYAGADADPAAGGRLLLGELNCVSCHQAEDSLAAHVAAKKAPILDEVGRRLRVDHLRRFLADPAGVKPGTTMPSLFANADPAEKERRVEALVHFLAADAALPESSALPSAARRGEQLFHRVGCAACHQPLRGKAPPLATSVPLGDLKDKYSVPSLAAFLENPLHTRPSARMPALSLTADEARDIASYLLQGIEAAANVKYRYYEGNWDKLPDFAKLKPKTEGESPTLSLDVAERRDQFAVRFESFLIVSRNGNYTFHLSSDDGSRLLVDGELVVDNDGVHATTSRSGRRRLEKGAYPIAVEYFEAGGEEVLQVEIEGPGLSRRPLDDALAMTAEGPKEGKRGFESDPALASQGRELFARLGCADCHELRREGALVAASSSAPKLADLRPDQGCLASAVPRGAAHYPLSFPQRRALTEALKSPATAPPTTEQTAHRLLAALNCYACHDRNGLGGVEEARNSLFAGNMPEMGDEGRIPPHLTGVGAKLRSDWMRHIFEQGGKERAYMFTRMPKFGQANAGALIEAFEELDAAAPYKLPQIEASPRRLKEEGRRLVGAQGLGCVKCHQFGSFEASGIQAVKLTTMHRRLKPDWYQRYMLNPQAFRPGTRMPAAWPDGQTFFADILDGSSDAQIRAIWVYLTDGDKAAVPAGVGPEVIELTADQAPVIYRNFIDGAGTRAIGVGYPERVNLAFDANAMSAALLWHGPFIDASRHWSGRGQGFQPPLGHNVLRWPAGPSVAALADPAASWPTQSGRELGYRLLGYRLDASRRPEFRYQVGEAVVHDFFEPAQANGHAGFRRRIRLEGQAPPGGLWLRAAVGRSIEPRDGWHDINNDWKTRLTSTPGEPIVRASGDQFELLVPIQSTDGRAEVVQEIWW